MILSIGAAESTLTVWTNGKHVRYDEDCKLLFIPETRGGEIGAARVFYVFRNITQAVLLLMGLIMFVMH